MSRKFMITLITLIMSLGILGNTEVSAQPVPPLTNLQIIGVTSDGNNYVWENINFNQQRANIPMSGTEGVLAIYVEGWQHNNNHQPFVLWDGTSISSQTYKPLPDEFLYDSTGKYYGRIVYKAFPLDIVDSGRFTVESWDYYQPSKKLYDHLYIDVAFD